MKKNALRLIAAIAIILGGCETGLLGDETIYEWDYPTPLVIEVLVTPTPADETPTPSSEETGTPVPSTPTPEPVVTPTSEPDLDEDGYSVGDGDCDDRNADVYPGAIEVCDSKDNDCDGQIDEDQDFTTWYQDADGDRYGAVEGEIEACSAPSGYVPNNGDCDDTIATINPGAVETCNELDDDCDGTVDEAGAVDESVFFYDTDGDGFGSSTGAACPSQFPEDFADLGGDCNDQAPAIYPGATEVACGVDQNCDGSVYPCGTTDADGDGFTGLQGDCDDTKTAVGPNADEICDGVDNDCDGEVDEEAVDAQVLWDDDDGDGYGDDVAGSFASCPEAGFVTQGGDCDDTDPTIFEGCE